MADRLMYIPNDDTQIFPFWRLQLVVEIFGHTTQKPANQISIEVLKVVTNKKTLLKIFGISVTYKNIVSRRILIFSGKF